MQEVLNKAMELFDKPMNVLSFAREMDHILTKAVDNIRFAAISYP